MFRIIRDPSSEGHLHILTKVLQIHGASPYSRHGGCIAEHIVCTVCCVEEDCLLIVIKFIDIPMEWGLAFILHIYCKIKRLPFASNNYNLSRFYALQ